MRGGDANRGKGTYMLVFRNEQQKDLCINSLKAIGNSNIILFLSFTCGTDVFFPFFLFILF